MKTKIEGEDLRHLPELFLHRIPPGNCFENILSNYSDKCTEVNAIK